MKVINKIFNAEELDFFLKTVVKNWILNPESEKFFKLCGVKETHWPRDCRAVTILKEFTFLSDLKGRAAAIYLIGHEYTTWPEMSLPIELYDFKTLYENNITAYLTKELGKNLINAPLEASRLLLDYKNSVQTTNELIDLKDTISDAIKANEVNINNGTNLVVLPDFPVLSKSIGGFNPSRISMIGAISGFGKTKLAINLALSASKIMNVMYFNMEMSLTDFASMFIQKYCKISSDEWADGSYLKNPLHLNAILEFKKALNNQSSSIKITNGKSLSINNIVTQIYANASKEKPSLVIIDYDQKIILSQAQEQEWVAMLNTIVLLEDTSRDTNTHIIILYQANDLGEVKSSKRSMQPASTVLAFQKDEMGKNFIRSIKNRFAAPFRLEVTFDAATTSISEKQLLPLYDEPINKERKPYYEIKPSRKPNPT